MKKLTVIAAVALAIASPSASYAFTDGNMGGMGHPVDFPSLSGLEKMDPVKVKATWQCVFSFGTNKDACAAAK
jgi:hypothetical protein